MARQIALAHHERWDGTGYPAGLAGEKIPLAARIVSIADVYDALRNRRPYKRGWTHEECVALIRKEAGKMFDPELVAAMVRIEGSFSTDCPAIRRRGVRRHEAARGGAGADLHVVMKNSPEPEGCNPDDSLHERIES